MRRTLATLGILPGTFYRWYDRLQSGGPEALEDRSPRPRRVWNRIPDDVREQPGARQSCVYGLLSAKVCLAAAAVSSSSSTGASSISM